MEQAKQMSSTFAIIVAFIIASAGGALIGTAANGSTGSVTSSEDCDYQICDEYQGEGSCYWSGGHVASNCSQYTMNWCVESSCGGDDDN